MNQRRTGLLLSAVVWLLVPLALGLLGGNIGPVEFVIWLLGFAALITAFFTWGRQGGQES
jgi:hypothetical protein